MPFYTPDGGAKRFEAEETQILNSCGYDFKQTFNRDREGILVKRDFANIVELNQTIDCLENGEGILALVHIQADRRKTFLGKEEIKLVVKIPTVIESLSLVPAAEVTEEMGTEGFKGEIEDATSVVYNPDFYVFMAKANKIRFALPGNISIDSPQSELIDIEVDRQPEIVAWQMEQKKMAIGEFETYARKELSKNRLKLDRTELAKSIKELDKSIFSLKKKNVKTIYDASQRSGNFLYDRELKFEATSSF